MFSQEAADRAINFIQLLKHTKGEWAGENFILEEWQREEIVSPLFGTLNDDGTRQYRTLWLEVARKNGKSELAGAIANLLTFADNEPGAEIYGAAADRDNAGIVYDVARVMVEQSPALMKRSQIIRSTKRIVVPSTNSYYKAISSEAYTKFGYNPHGILFDEVHAQPNRELWDVLTTAGGARRQPLTVAITTAGYDRNSICWELHDYAMKIKSGVIDDPTWLVVIYAADEDDDWTDEEVWRKANPALGTFRSINELRTSFKKAQETPAFEMTFRRLYLNQWVSSSERWLSLDKWDECGDTIRKRDVCYAGLDLSATTDLTALALLFPQDTEPVEYDVLMHFWIPEDTMIEKERKDRVPYSQWVKQGFVTATPGNVIDYGFIQKALETYREQFNIREIAFDRWGATKLSQDLDAADFTMVPFGQGFASMSAPTKELMNLVLGHLLRHGGNPVLRWNCDNLVVEQDAAGNLKPSKKKSTQKIDGMVALIMSIDRASRHQTSGSKYEDGPLLVL